MTIESLKKSFQTKISDIKKAYLAKRSALKQAYDTELTEINVEEMTKITIEKQIFTQKTEEILREEMEKLSNFAENAANLTQESDIHETVNAVVAIKYKKPSTIKKKKDKPSGKSSDVYR